MYRSGNKNKGKRTGTGPTETAHGIQQAKEQFLTPKNVIHLLSLRKNR